MSRYLLIVLLCFSNAMAYCRHYPFINYTRTNGLPSNTVYSIFRDNKGLLWFGTDKGVATYNGIDFKTYTTSDGLPDNEIFFFQQDYENRIWMSTLNGELCYYKEGKFYNPANTPYLKINAKLSTVNYLLIEQDSSVTAGFYSYPVIVNICKGRCKVIDFSAFAASMNCRDVITVKKLSPDLYRLYTSEKMLLVDSNAHLLSVTPYKNHEHYTYSIAQHQEYLLNPKGIYNIQQQPLLAAGNPDFSARSCRIYRSGKDFFIATFSGLFINNNIHLLNNIRTSSVTQDIDGNYWISTLGNGVYVLPGQYADIQEYKNAYNSTVKFAAADSNNHLFFTTADNNFYRFSDGTTECLFDYAATHRNMQQPSQPAFIISGRKYFAFYNQENYVIKDIYRKDAPVAVYKTKISNDLKNIFATGTDIYICRPNEILLPDYTACKPHTQLHIESRLKEKNWLRMCCMGFDAANNFLVSANDSVFRIDRNWQITYLPQFGSVTFRWANIYGQYFVGCTNKNQLRICNWASGKLYTDTIGQECIWNSSCRLDSNHILISTNSLYRILTLFPTDGAPRYKQQVVESPFIPVDADYITSNGEKCFFFKNGAVIAAGIQMLLHNAKQPTVYFTSLKTQDTTYAAEPVMHLSYDDTKNISINFNTISFSSKNLTYEYTLSRDTTDNWHIIQNPEINLVTPGYGIYNIKVRAKSITSAQSAPACLQLIIDKPLRAEAWFIILTGLISLGLLTALIYCLIKYLLKKRERQHQANIRFLKSEYKALNALMNPHFIFNSLNNIQAFINTNDRISANKYLDIFSTLVRQNMHNITQELIPLQKEIDLVIHYLQLEKLRFNDWLNFSIDIEEDIELDLINIPPLLLQPLVENAIKHGLLPRQSHDNHISIQISEIGNSIHISIEDNGVGLGISSRKTGHESFGLSNIRNRIARLRDIYENDIEFLITELRDNSGVVAGTRAIIIIHDIPVQHTPKDRS